MLTKEQWDNSPELRGAIADRLFDWGWHSFGGGPDHGFPTHSTFTTPPSPNYSRYQPTHGPDDAQEVDYIISSAAQASLLGLRNAEVLRIEFVRRDLTKKQRARRLGYSRRTYQRRLDGAMFWFYRLAITLKQPAADWVKTG